MSTSIDKPSVLVIDDQYADTQKPSHRKQFLEDIGDELQRDWIFSWCSGLKDGQYDVDSVIQEIKAGWNSDRRWSLVLLDVRFGDEGKDKEFGFKVLEALRASDGLADLPVVILTGEDRGKNEKAAELGADGYLPKDTITGETLRRRMALFGLYPDQLQDLIGKSLPFLKTLREARRTAILNLDRVIYGETGSGKTALGKFIHRHAKREEETYISWSARASSDQAIIGSKLFGYWKGAYTGADQHAQGVFEQAHNGTVLLDEIHNLGDGAQQLLLDVRHKDGKGLRHVQRQGAAPAPGEYEKEIKAEIVKGGKHPVTGVKTQPVIGVKTQLLCATNVRLYQESTREQYRFRKDLLNGLGHPLYYPALNERLNDVPLLLESFVRKKRLELQTLHGSKLDSDNDEVIHKDVCAWAKKQDWQDRNIAVLKNVAEYAAATSIDFDMVYMAHLGPYLDSAKTDSSSGEESTTPTKPRLSNESLSLDEAIQTLRHAIVPNAAVLLDGQLGQLRVTLAPIVLKLFRAAAVERDHRPQSVISLLLGETLGTVEARKFIGYFAKLFPELGEDEITKELVVWAKRPKAKPTATT